MRTVLLLMDAGIAIIFLIIGYAFLKSNGKASKFIAGYNTKIQFEKQQYDETRLCNDYGKRMMLWAIPFTAGFVFDYFFIGVGSVLAWVAWIILFIWHVIDMTKNENRYKR